MEKIQQPGSGKQQPEGTETENRPGQQLPTSDPGNKLDQPTTQENETWHSDTSFPHNDRETLGTP